MKLVVMLLLTAGVSSIKVKQAEALLKKHMANKHAKMLAEVEAKVEAEV